MYTIQILQLIICEKVKSSSIAKHSQLLMYLMYRFQGICLRMLKVSVKKALDLIGEKTPLVLPDPALVEQALGDETIPDPLQQKVADGGRTVLLDEDVVWPVSGEVFNLNVRISTL